MLKHAEASEIHINLKVSNEILCATFKDNGCRFDVHEMLENGIKNKHAGIKNLQKRCNLIKAELKIKSAPNKGSEFIINLPL